MNPGDKKTIYGEWVIRYRWPVIILTLAVALAASSGGRFLEFSNDYRYFFGSENPQLKAFEKLQDTYAKNDSVLFALAPQSGRVFTRETLAVVEELTRDAWQIPYSSRVDSITNFQHTAVEGDELVVGDLVEGAGGLGDAELARVKSIALAEPLLNNRLITDASDVTGVNVTINLPGRSIDEVPEVAAFVRGMAEVLRSRHPEMDVYLTGISMMNNSFSEASKRDMKSLVPLMFLVIVVVMGVLLRSVCGTLSTVLVIGFSALTAMGIAGWLGIPITPPSASAPTIILTLGVADSIHILITMFDGMRKGMERNEAIVESLRVNLQPVFLTSITTAIGFLSMNFSDAPPFRDLGNIVAVGVMAAFVYSVLFLPALMSVMPVKCRAKGDPKRYRMDVFSGFVVRRRMLLYWSMLAVIAALSLGITRIEFNDQFVEYFDESYAFRTDTDYVTENLTGIYLIGYSLGAEGEGGISDPAYLSTVEEFAEWYRSEPGVVHVNTITDTMKRLNRNMHGDDPEYYRTPGRRDLAAQYLLLYELSLPFGLDLNNQINVNKSATRFTATLKSLSVKDLLALEGRARQWLRTNAPESMYSEGASPTIMFSHIAKRNIRSMMGGTALALVLISAILVVALRSFKIGVVSLVPNLAPAFMAFGLCGATSTSRWGSGSRSSSR